MPMAISARLRSPAPRFALTALTCTFGIFGLLRLPWVEAAIVWPVTRLQGAIAAALSGARALPVEVTLACSGTDVMAMCAGAIIAYPARWQARVAGAVGGVALILVLNVLRIATLGAAAHAPEVFALLHLYVWPAALALAAAGYVFMWIRMAGGEARPAGSARIEPPLRRFAWLTGAAVIVFAAASPWYLTSAWVLAVASAIASVAAVLLRLFGIAAVASGNLLMTARGGFMVTQECVATPLIPISIAAILAFAPSWKARVVALLAVVPVFMFLGVVRLLVVAVPPALVGSPLFFIHAFYQLLAGAALVVAAAWWRHGAARAWRRAAVALGAAVILLAALAPLAARLVASDPRLIDPQGAIALVAPFQIALLVGLWCAAVAPARPGLLAVLAALFLASHAGLFAFVQMPGAVTLLEGQVPAIRAWAIALPLAGLLAMRGHAQPDA